jgi:hypothetical protein
VAIAPLCAVDAVEEDDAFVLFSASDETVSGHGLDWAVELAWVLGCCWTSRELRCWAATKGKPGKPLSLSYSFSIFLFLFSVLIFLFGFKFAFSCFLQVLNYLSIKIT